MNMLRAKIYQRLLQERLEKQNIDRKNKKEKEDNEIKKAIKKATNSLYL